jgi:5'-phosphate synthase pdxT subunit
MVGVLGLQGGYGLHAAVVRRLGHEVKEVRDPEDLPGLTALILPGGESTVMGLLLERRGLMAPLREALSRGLPVLGTCAGAILLARDIEASDQLRLGVLDMTVARNAYGSQIDSFDTTLAVRGVPGLDQLPGVFIRAPKITQTGPGVAVLSTWGGFPVLVRSGSMVAATFHPELTESVELHRWFLSLVRI